MFFSTITAAFLLASTPVTAPIPLTDFAKPSEVSSIELSPDGKQDELILKFKDTMNHLSVEIQLIDFANWNQKEESKP